MVTSSCLWWRKLCEPCAVKQIVCYDKIGFTWKQRCVCVGMGLSLATKKRLTRLAQAIFILFNGVEFAVIIPTLNEYVAHLGGDVTFFGIIMSAFSFTGVLASPIFGVLQDRFNNTKTLVLFSLLWAIAGNFMYFYGGSTYMLLGSRLVAGVSTGALPAIYAHVSKTTTEAERAGVMAFLMAARQLGLMFGPALNLPISVFNFKIGPLPVNSLTAPGFVMCVMFVLLSVIMMVCYYDIPPLSKAEVEKPDSAERITKTSEHKTERESFSMTESTCVENSEEYDTSEPRRKRRTHRGKRKLHTTIDIKHSEASVETFSRIDVVLLPEVVVLLTAQFLLSFIQTCQETLLTVMTRRLLNYGAIPNSIIMALVGVELLIVMIIIKFVNRFISDRTMLFGGVMSDIPPFIVLLIVYPIAPPGQVHQNLWWFALSMSATIPALGFGFIGMMSLFSKVTPIAMQGYAHGIRRVVSGIATIMGPLWAGCIENWPYETPGVMLGAIVFTWVMILLSWSRLKPHSATTQQRTVPVGEGNGETQALLQETDFTDIGDS